MPKARPNLPKPPLPDKATTAKFMEIIHAAMDDYAGSSDQLESAIGFLFVGHYYGWRVLYLIHSKKTVRQHEKILGISVREMFQEEGPYAYRSVAWSVAKKLSNFWKIVSGDVKLPKDVKRLDFI